MEGDEIGRAAGGGRVEISGVDVSSKEKAVELSGDQFIYEGCRATDEGTAEAYLIALFGMYKSTNYQLWKMNKKDCPL